MIFYFLFYTILNLFLTLANVYIQRSVFLEINRHRKFIVNYGTITKETPEKV